MDSATLAAFEDELQKISAAEKHAFWGRMAKPFRGAAEKLERASLGGSYVSGKGSGKGALDVIKKYQPKQEVRGRAFGQARPPAQDPFRAAAMQRAKTMKPSGLELAL